MFCIAVPSEARLERPQEVDDFLLLLGAQLIEMSDDLICLAALASVISDRVHQVVCPSVMEEEDPLSDTPERSGSELVRAGTALRDAVSEAFAHVVDKKVRVKIRRLIGERSTGARRRATRNHFASRECRRVALDTSYPGKGFASLFARCCGRNWSRWGQHPHEVRERFDV
jgi:hypothetical protein